MNTQAKAWVVEPQSDEMCGFWGKYAIGITDRLRTIFDAHTGEMLMGPRYNGLSLAFGNGLVAVRVADKWGYADLRGDLAIPAQFRNMSTFQRGIAWGERGARCVRSIGAGDGSRAFPVSTLTRESLMTGTCYQCADIDAEGRGGSAS